MLNTQRVSRWLLSALQVCCLLSCSLLASAQEGTATVRGTVSDADGATVSGSRLSVVLQGSDPDTLPLVINSTGEYSITGLNPGVYQIKVETAGFKTILVTNLRLLAGDTQELKFTLQAGSADEVITLDSSDPPSDPPPTV